jgi:hypothetical protein
MIDCFKDVPELDLIGKKRIRLKKLLLDEVANYLYKQMGGKEICVSASWLVSMALNLYGVRCYMRCCKIMFGNRIAFDLVKEAGEWLPLSDKGKYPNAWTIGLGFGRKYSELVPIHAVIYFPKDNSIMDLTACQISRPEKNLPIENYWVKLDELDYPFMFFEFVENDTSGMGIVHHPKLEEVFNTVSRKIATVLKQPFNYTSMNVQLPDKLRQDFTEKMEYLKKQKIIGEKK